ncbi:hypothetical protein FRB90_009117 [Tulasnella sp. 427]|nr:hypothetical protein FRB90_009117 [Tulasnella sp. 427]
MSFHNAPVTKGVMLGLALSSLAAGIFNVKHYFHLQLVPHISRDHQYWRLLTSQLIFGNSSELLLAETLLYNIAINIERRFGSRKFGSFLLVTLGVSTFFTFAFLLLFHGLGVNYIPPGPLTMVFAILYQHYRIIPPVYHFRISYLNISNKGFEYFLAWLLIISDPPGTLLASLVGIATGQLYRSDLVNLKSYRVSPSLERFCKRFLLPLIGSTRPPTRPVRALPDFAAAPEVLVRDQTTARPGARDTAGAGPSGSGEETPADSGAVGDGTSVSARQPSAQPSAVSQWVDTLTGRRGADGVYVPASAEITVLMTMFPGVPRETVVRALEQSNGDASGAVDNIFRTLGSPVR